MGFRTKEDAIHFAEKQGQSQLPSPSLTLTIRGG